MDGGALDRPPAPASPAAAPSAPKTVPSAAPGPTARVEEPWTVAISRSDQRKMLTAEVVEAYAGGTITDTTLIWKHGMQRWQPPFDIPAIALALLARGLEPRPRETDQRAKTEPPPAPASNASDWDDEATRVFDAAVVAEDFAAPKPAAPGAPRAPSSPMARSSPSAAPPQSAPAEHPPPPTNGAASPESPASDWDDENEATKMLAPSRALLAARLPKRSVPPSGAPDAKKSRPPPVPPRRAKAPARAPKPPPARSVPPPAKAPAPGALTPSPTKSVGAAAGDKAVQTVRPPPGAPIEDPFGFEDEATAVITADRAKALLEEQLETPAAAPASETPLSFGSDTAPSEAAGPAKPGTGSGPTGAPRARRESLRSYDDLVEKGPTIVVAETEKKRISKPPPPQAPLPPVPTPPPSGRPSARDFGGIQQERTRVVRPRKKATGPLFWLALIVALTGAAFAGYYASRLLDPAHFPSLQRR